MFGKEDYVIHIDDICARDIFEKLPPTFNFKHWAFEIGQEALGFYAPSKRVIQNNENISFDAVNQFVSFVESGGNYDASYVVNALSDLLSYNGFGTELLCSFTNTFDTWDDDDDDDRPYGTSWEPYDPAKASVINDIRELVAEWV